MSKKRIKKIAKITGILLLVALIAFSILFYNIFKPKSDTDILDLFANELVQPHIKYLKYKENKIRVIQMQKEIDSTIPTLVFVHGSPGSAMDFKEYLKDNDLNSKSNIICYDRVGYGETERGKILGSIKEEVEVLDLIIQGLKTSELILIGYSYGGTTVLAYNKKVKKNFY